jgi:riboflavin-specific deaminase-like protein
VRQLLPEPIEGVDVYDAYRIADAATSLRVNMVSSVDGSVTDEKGRSGLLGGAGDREVFRTLRAQADAILVGAGTVRAEGYGPHILREDLAARRLRDGRSQPAAIVVVTRSLDLDLSSALFTDAVNPTVVLTCAAAPEEARAAAARAGRVVVAGEGDVDLEAGLRLLREEHGWAHILCEGGPRLNRRLFAARVVDELCLTIAPALVNGDGPRLVSSLPGRVRLDLVRLLAKEGELFCRYRVRD